MRKIFTWLAASLLLTAGLAFAMTKSTLSESEFASEIGKKTFAVFVKDGSRYTMYKPSSPSSAESELRSALPGGRMEIYTAISPCVIIWTRRAGMTISKPNRSAATACGTSPRGQNADQTITSLASAGKPALFS